MQSGGLGRENLDGFTAEAGEIGDLQSGRQLSLLVVPHETELCASKKTGQPETG